MAILQKLVSHGGKRLSLYADKGCHLRKMAALLFPEESSTILRLHMSVCRAEIYNEILAEMKVLTSTIRQAALSAVSQKTAV